MAVSGHSARVDGLERDCAELQEQVEAYRKERDEERLARHQTPAMQAVYLQLYAESWGRGRPTVRISQKDIAERIGVAARRTVQVAIEKLVYKDHIRLVDNPVFRPHSQDAKEYQVRSAEDVLGPPSPV